METFTRWEPVRGIDRPCSEVLIQMSPAATLARLRFAEQDDLVLDLGLRVPAFMSHEEFVHPWAGEDADVPLPKLSDRWARYSYPLLEVHQSRWLASFTDSQIMDWERAAAKHYRLISLDNTVDLLVIGPVVASWVPSLPTENQP